MAPLEGGLLGQGDGVLLEHGDQVTWVRTPRVVYRGVVRGPVDRDDLDVLVVVFFEGDRPVKPHDVMVRITELTRGWASPDGARQADVQVEGVMAESKLPPIGVELDLVAGDVPALLRRIADDIEQDRPGITNGVGGVAQGSDPVAYRLVNARLERDHEMQNERSEDGRLAVFRVAAVDVALRLRFEP